MNEWGGFLIRFVNISCFFVENEGGEGDGCEVEKVKVVIFGEVLKNLRFGKNRKKENRRNKGYGGIDELRLLLVYGGYLFF